MKDAVWSQGDPWTNPPADLLVAEDEERRVQVDSPGAFQLCKARNPRSRLDCILQIIDGPFFGELTETLSGIAVKMSLDAGLHENFSFQLGLHVGGSSLPESGKQKWNVDDHVNGPWVIQAMEINRITQVGEITHCGTLKSLSGVQQTCMVIWSASHWW